MIKLESIEYLDLEYVHQLIEKALAEDLSDRGDITTNSVVPEQAEATATLIAKEAGIVAGLPFFEMVFATVFADFEFCYSSFDGEAVAPRQALLTITGPARAMLIAERTALNLTSHLSGIASLTSAYAKAIEGTAAVVVDTRKTLPGMRTLEKYAVYCGGGTNHRIGLFDAFLIKENHLAMGGGVTACVNAARAAFDLPVQVEVETLAQLEEAIAVGADSVLLDNMTPEQTREAVALARKLADANFVLESSGGITLETIRAYAETGVDRISVGALTHSAPGLDLSLNIEPTN